MGLEEEALAAVTAELAAEELVQGAVKAEVGGGACTHARGGWVGGEGDSAAPARTHPCLSIMPPPPLPQEVKNKASLLPQKEFYA